MSGKIIVINKKSILRSLLALSIVAIMCLVGFNATNIMVETGSKNRLLPIYSVEIDKKQVALTFDCAWGADDIPSIIEVLNKNNVKATFFTVGDWVSKYPDVIKALYDAGMEIRKSYF